MRRCWLLAAAAGVIVAGLVLRLIHFGLPVWTTHSGGGFLWGAMIYLLVAASRPPRWRIGACLMTTSILVIAIELSRLYHTPSLDTFRMTLAGQLLSGRLFSPWNMLIYEAGAVVAAIVTRPLVTLETRDRQTAHASEASLPP